MRLPILLILLLSASAVMAQTKAKSSPPAHAHVKPQKDTAQILTTEKPVDPQTPCYLIMPRWKWYQLVQLLDASEGSHSAVKDLITYISTNAKEVPPTKPDSLAAKPKP